MATELNALQSQVRQPSCTGRLTEPLHAPNASEIPAQYFVPLPLLLLLFALLSFPRGRVHGSQSQSTRHGWPRDHVLLESGHPVIDQTQHPIPVPFTGQTRQPRVALTYGHQLDGG